MLTSYIMYTERNSNPSFNIVISLGTIPCFNFVTRMLYIWKSMIKKLQCQTGVDQEMVTINDLQIPINIHFWLKCNKQLYICLENVGRNLHSLLYISITFPYCSFIVILKHNVHLDLTWHFLFRKTWFIYIIPNPQFTK